MKTNVLQLDPEMSAKLASYAEGDEVQCLVTVKVGAKGSLTVLDIEPEGEAEEDYEEEETDEDEGADEPDAMKSSKKAPALEKALKA